ncbi:hypothetical protein [Halotia branconii]|uniref:Uncharacterized protein n=1 Tax=Halotia branconii CENA392 TaxID=1539056 RepID=A0AAJ6NR69_9CYAN|nr:hypothetical protein [Halotia branconii]WGV25097.1 hypothetical protein QI031_25620 [Halotia branconii CENA392]
MDELVKKLAGLGLPGIILVVLAASSAGSNAAIVAALTAVGGPLGIIGGIGLLGLAGVLGDAISGFGVEAILKAVYSERSKNESVRVLLKEINDLPISDELKLKLKNHLSPEHTTYAETVEGPRTVEIVEE